MVLTQVSPLLSCACVCGGKASHTSVCNEHISGSICIFLQVWSGNACKDILHLVLLEECTDVVDATSAFILQYKSLVILIAHKHPGSKKCNLSDDQRTWIYLLLSTPPTPWASVTQKILVGVNIGILWKSNELSVILETNRSLFHSTQHQKRKMFCFNRERVFHVRTSQIWS